MNVFSLALPAAFSAGWEFFGCSAGAGKRVLAALDLWAESEQSRGLHHTRLAWLSLKILKIRALAPF
jgi:hypothetical protein